MKTTNSYEYRLKLYRQPVEPSNEWYTWATIWLMMITVLLATFFHNA